MLKHITLSIMLLMTLSGAAQDFSALWEGHFSYYNIKDIAQGYNKIYAASENAVFSYDIDTQELETITTIDGLSGETISTIAYSEDYQLLLIGYENGLIEIVSERDDNIITVVDILDKETISPAIKRINHFNEDNGYVYISTDFGISVYNLSQLEFGDTYYIGNGGAQINVNQTTVYGDQIYAACGNNNAIKKANITNPNLIDYQQWQTLNSGNFIAVQSVEDKLYAVKSNRALFEISNDSFNQLYVYASSPLDVKTIAQSLVITTKDNVFVYNSNFTLLASAAIDISLQTSFTAATLTSNFIYAGTTSQGVLQMELNNLTEYTLIRPEGPLKNKGFKIEAGNNELWMTYGEYTWDYNPYPLDRLGVSRLKDDQWNNIPFDSLYGAIDLNKTIINPFKPSQVFMSSFFSGLLEFNNGAATDLWNASNSGLESLVLPSDPNYTDIRQSGMQFDRNGMLWMMTSRVDRPLKSYDPANGGWQSFSYTDIIPNGLEDELGFSDLVIDNTGTKWVGSFLNGVIGFNENGGNYVIKRIFNEDHNMPSENVQALAIDNRNQLWIGTIKGIRVLYNTSGFFEEPDPSANEIVILEDNIPKELLSNQFITDIKVDGSNNKWVGTLTSGLFYFSPDAQETIYHFTKDNSPLPSNAVVDLSIDTQNGRLYIATDKGLVSFLSGGSDPQEHLESAFVYPNPVRPEYNILGANNLNDINKGVKIKGLTENVNIKITDIEGNLVAEAQSRVNLRSSNSNYNFAIDGGTAIWNGRNLANNIVASGVYLILISDLDSLETKVLKLLIIQ